MNNIKNRLLLNDIERRKNERENPKYIDMEKIKQDKIEYHKTHPDVKPDCLVGGWILYIIVMIGGMIFKDYFFLAIYATIYFFWWRHDKIERANGRKYDD